MPRITAARARAILGSVATDLTEPDLEQVIDFLFQLAELAVDAFDATSASIEVNPVTEPLDECIADRAQALIEAGLPPEIARRMSEHHYSSGMGDGA